MTADQAKLDALLKAASDVIRHYRTVHTRMHGLRSTAQVLLERMEVVLNEIEGETK